VTVELCVHIGHALPFCKYSCRHWARYVESSGAVIKLRGETAGPMEVDWDVFQGRAQVPEVLCGYIA
jgi:hypothetical protein